MYTLWYKEADSKVWKRYKSYAMECFANQDSLQLKQKGYETKITSDNGE
jgi:hypothetical protein